MHNTSTLDRIIRLMISLALFQLAFFWLAGGWQIVGITIGVIALATAALGVCPVYCLIGMSVTTSCGKLRAHQDAMTEGLKNDACSCIMGDRFAHPNEGASDVVQPRSDCTADAE